MSQLETLLKKIEDRTFTVGIIGLGYVGLPLMWTFHQNDMPVLGFDIDIEKVENLKNGIPYIKHLGTEMMETLAKSDIAYATIDFSRLDEADAILLCVPTPLNHHREPDISYVEQTTETVSKHLRKGQLVILESTTWPGTTEELMIPILEKNSGLKAGKDFYVAYSPEREDPGNPNFNTAKIPKVVGGHGEEALKLATAIYDMTIVQTVLVSDSKTVEAFKLTENIFRSVNIALVNELKVVYEAMDIDVHEVLDAAATKPFGFMKFTPGPGLGGHCIPIDPFYLTWKAREFERHTRFIELAGEVNTDMPRYVVERTMHALNTHKKAMNGSKILVIGLAYKPDVDDMRESQTFKIFDLLKKNGAEVSYYDPFIPEVLPTREHAEWMGTKSIEWNKEAVLGFDAVLISTNHSTIDYSELVEWSECVVDTRNAMNSIEAKNDKHLFKASTKLKRKEYDIIIISAGIIGGAIAYKLSLKGDYKIAVIDKEPKPNMHQTGRNSGVIHSGVYYPKNSLKSKNCIDGYNQLVEFLKDNEIPFKITGKLIAAADESEYEELARLYESAMSVGLNVKYMDENDIKFIDQNLITKKGFFVEETGITDYKDVLNKFIELSSSNRVDYYFSNEVISVSHGNITAIRTSNNEFETKHVINCSGLQCDRVYEICTNRKSPVTIIPFKGEYYIVPENFYSSDVPIYPVPNPNFPFLGVHLTRMIDGTLKVVPNAVLSFDREGYDGFNFDIGDSLKIISNKALYNIGKKYSSTVVKELLKHGNKTYFEANVRKYWSNFSKEDIIGYTFGIRAHATEDGELVSDFRIENFENQIHVLNAPSPAATSCLAIADQVISYILNY